MHTHAGQVGGNGACKVDQPKSTPCFLFSAEKTAPRPGTLGRRWIGVQKSTPQAMSGASERVLLSQLAQRLNVRIVVCPCSCLCSRCGGWGRHFFVWIIHWLCCIFLFLSFARAQQCQISTFNLAEYDMLEQSHAMSPASEDDSEVWCHTPQRPAGSVWIVERQNDGKQLPCCRGLSHGLCELVLF